METMATICGYCKERPMLQVPNPLLKHVPNQTSLPTGIMMCANCDSPDGITPPPDPDEDEVTERDLGGK